MTDPLGLYPGQSFFGKVGQILGCMVQMVSPLGCQNPSAKRVVGAGIVAGEAMRTPDYVTIEGSLGHVTGFTGSGSLTRHGDIYAAPGGYGGIPPGLEVSLRVGWLNQKTCPTESELRRFKDGWSNGVAGTLPNGFSAAGFANESGSATELGIGSPSLSFSGSEGLRMGSVPIGW